ncbi:MAG TPA: hypothetical protein VGQ20_02615 [Acidimicrobiales bacterium]|jgi:hypothetical protein|nr:hypothetical protein [Acidimicrobiales bacterium]
MFRINGVVFDIETTGNVRPVDPHRDHCPAGWLKATVVGYNAARDETVEVELIVPPRHDDPTQPDWSFLAPPAC